VLTEKTVRTPSLSAAARKAGATKIVRCVGKNVFAVGFLVEHAKTAHAAVVAQFGSAAVTWDGSLTSSMIVRL
jgi:hypothetical protein